MRDWLAQAASTRPNTIALHTDQHTWTYAELNQRVAVMCANLVETGIKSGDHVGALLPNCADYVVIVHALARLGAVLVPLNIRLTSAELYQQSTAADIRAIISAAPHHDKIRDWTHIQHLDPVALSQPTATDYYDGEIDLNATQSIIFTSGTTGAPKGAQITFNNLWSNAIASSWRIGTLPHDRWLCPIPLFHIGGLSVLFRSCLYSTGVILQQGFDLDALIKTIHEQNVTLISLVPTMLQRLITAHPDATMPDSLRLILLGGAQAPTALIEHCRQHNIPVALTYGLTEACSQVATALPEDTQRKPYSVGKPLAFTQVRIADSSGNTLPTGEKGEIVVKGAMVMAGYYKQPNHPALQNGELYTGDIGYLDEDGDLCIIQRRSDLIVSGGENIYPTEIEAALRQHPAVADACVVGIPDQEWGQRVAAAVVLNPNATLAPEDLIIFARQHLAGYKIPRVIRIIDALPQNASGKITRPDVVSLFT